MIEQIINLGDDALLNQFRLVFPSGIPFGGTGENIALRMDQSIDLPEETVAVYEYFFRGIKITKASMLDETAKEITFDVRIDSQWAVFDDLNGWKQKVHNPNAGTRLPFALTSTTMLVQMFTGVEGEDTPVKQVRFGGVVLKGLKGPALEHGASDPARATLSFIFQTMKYE